MLELILLLLVIGVVVGLLARLIVLAHDPLGVGPMMVLGVVGSFVGGFLGYMLLGHDLDESVFQLSAIGSVLGAVGALLEYRGMSGRRVPS